MRPILFHVGETGIPSFWVAAFAGFFAAFVVVRSEVLRRGHSVDLAYDMILYAYVGGWLGARLFLIPSAWDLVVEDPLGFLLSGSGWVWYGGVIGGGLAMLSVARRYSLSLLYLADIAAPALAVGLAIGRVGCQLSGDGDYGVPTELPWCMRYPNGVVPTTDCVHPAPVYEMLACLAIFVHLWRRREIPRPAGAMFAQYLVLSGLTRFAIETVRRNPAWLLGFTTAQFFSILMVLLGGALLWRGRIAAGETPA